jgi:3-deoxy-7-phosphoheptulonate synthase
VPIAFDALPAWSPQSWRGLRARHQPVYRDVTSFELALASLRDAASLVSIDQVEALRHELAEASRGDRFVVHAGDCAERFAHAEEAHLGAQAALLTSLAEALSQRLAKPVTTIGRIAGQFAKPRTSEFEERGGLSLPSYFGDLVNEAAFDAASRTPDPSRLLAGYDAARRSRHALDKIAPHIFSSHEGLHLAFEEALVRERDGRFFAGSAHLLWVGDRTRDPHEAHVEFHRGLANPVGVKLGPSATASDVRALVETLNPGRLPGKIALITRVGASRAGELLPAWVDAARDHSPVWLCDPMHGNTTRDSQGRKIRALETMGNELEEVALVLAGAGTPLAGLHLEATAEDVNECVQRAGLVPRDEPPACDPRLSARETFELVDRLF